MSWAFSEQPEHKIANSMILSFRMEFVIACCGVDYVYVEYEYLTGQPFYLMRKIISTDLCSEYRPSIKWVSR